MIKFVIKVTTSDGTEIVGGEQEVESQEVFDMVVDGLAKSVGSGNFKLTDVENDIIIIPQAVINNSLVQVIKTN